MRPAISALIVALLLAIPSASFGQKISLDEPTKKAIENRYLVVTGPFYTVDHKCSQGLHRAPNGPFAVFLFCHASLGNYIGVVYEGYTMVGPRKGNWDISKRFWQEEPFSDDITSFAWSDDGMRLYVGTDSVYGDGGFYELDLLKQRVRSIHSLGVPKSCSRRPHGSYISRYDPANGELEFVVVDHAASGPEKTISRTISVFEETYVGNVEILASCEDIVFTGKCHNSYFFTFRVDKVLSGEFKSKIFRTPEIYHDFGGGQIIHKLGAEGIRHRCGSVEKGLRGKGLECKNRVVIKLECSETTERRYRENRCRMIWIAREGEEEVQRKLEAIVSALCDSFISGKYDDIKPHLSKDTAFTKDVFDEMNSSPAIKWWKFKDRIMVFISERDGRQILGGSMEYKYSFELIFDSGSEKWIIKRVLKQK